MTAAPPTSATSATEPGAGHVAFLDLARGLSAQLVVVGHAMVMAWPQTWAMALPEGRLGARTDQFHIQSYAVVVFLVLSGFVITRSVRPRWLAGTYQFSSYLLDRAVRILTPLVPAIPVVLLLDRLVLGSSLWSAFVVVRHDPWTVIGNVLQLQDNAVLRGLDRLTGLDVALRSVGSAAPWWTVGYEWWIYLFFGAAVSLFVVRVRRGAGALVLAVTGAFAALSVVGFAAGGNFLGLAWLVGFAFAWWGERWTVGRRGTALIGGLAALLTVALLIRAPENVFSPGVVVGTGVALMTANRWFAGRTGRRTGLVAHFLAKYSYSLYLVHFSVLVWLVAAFPQP